MKRTLLCTLIAAAFLLTACTQKTPSAPEESQAGTELIEMDTVPAQSSSITESNHTEATSSVTVVTSATDEQAQTTVMATPLSTSAAPTETEAIGRGTMPPPAQTQPAAETQASTEQREEPMTEPEETQAPTEQETSPSVIPVTDIAVNVTTGGSYTYRGEPITIGYEYAAVGTTSFGLMVLCDGVAVPFSTNVSTDQQKVHIIPKTTAFETVSVELYVTPIGRNGQYAELQIVDIVQPDFDPYSVPLDYEDELLEFSRTMVWGQRFRAYSTGGMVVALRADGLSIEESVSENSSRTVIPEEDIIANTTTDEFGNTSNQLQYFHAEGTVNGLETIICTVKQGESVPIEITYSGTEGTELYTSFWLNNELYPIFDGCAYNRCTVDDEHYTTISGALDTSTLAPGRYICYTVCGSLAFNNYTSPTRFVLVVE